MMSISEKKISAKVWLIHAEEISLYNFLILRKKETQTEVLSCGICEIFKNSGGCC